MRVDKREMVMEKLKEVLDPEFGRPIVERGLIDSVAIDGNVARVTYHLTVPFCPLKFALYIGREIRKKALEVPGIERVQVRVKDHIQTAIINAELAKGD